MASSIYEKDTRTEMQISGEFKSKLFAGARLQRALTNKQKFVRGVVKPTLS